MHQEQQLPFQVIAIDLDGTLLRPDHSYDHARFERILDTCQERGLHVTIASGRQYAAMRQMFDRPEVLSFVGDNGASVADHDELVNEVTVPQDVLARALTVVDSHPGIAAVASGARLAWTRRDIPSTMMDSISRAYVELRVVDSLLEVPGPVSKFYLATLPGQSFRIAEELAEQLGDGLAPVTTGDSSIDLIVPGRHKAWGLEILLQRWGLDFSDVIAFGDSSNDLEMLRHAGTGYAMGGAEQAAIEASDRRAPSSADDGVMVVLEELLGMDR